MGSVRFRIANARKPILLVTARVNEGGRYAFVLDTGASMSVVSADLARVLGIRCGRTKEGMGAGGKVEVAVGRVASLSVGEARVRNLEVAIMDLGALGEALGARFDGILGYNFLRPFIVTIDYPRRTLTLEKGKRR